MRRGLLTHEFILAADYANQLVFTEADKLNLASRVKAALEEMYKRNYSAAIDLTNVAIQENGSDSFAYLIRGQCRLFLYNNTDATKDADQAIVLNNSLGFLLLAEIKRRSGGYAGALDALNTYTRKTKNNVLPAEGYAIRIDAKIGLFDLEGAYLDSLIMVYYHRAKALSWTMRAKINLICMNLKSAQQDMFEAHSRSSGDTCTYIYLAWSAEIKRQQGDYAATIAIADKQQSIQKLFYKLRAEAKLRSGDIDGAIMDCNQYLTSSDNAFALRTRAEAYYQKRDYDSALADATRAIELDNTYALAYTVRANIYRKQDQPQLAFDDDWKAYNINKRNKPLPLKILAKFHILTNHGRVMTKGLADVADLKAFREILVHNDITPDTIAHVREKQKIDVRLRDLIQDIGEEEMRRRIYT